MAKLIKAFRGVPNGALYPVEYEKGDECPPELEEAARELGCLAAKKAKKDDVSETPSMEMQPETQPSEMQETDTQPSETAQSE